jgi:hypothetical protein
MKLFADENFPRPAVAALRESSLDVLWIAETHPGAPDDEVFAQCISTKRTLLTFAKISENWLIAAVFLQIAESSSSA